MSIRKAAAIFIALTALFLGFFLEKPEQIAVVDLERVLNESSFASSLQDKLSFEGKKLQNSSGDAEEKYKKFMDLKNDIENKISRNIEEKVNTIAEKENYNVVLYKRFIHSGGIDITDQLIMELDKNLRGKVEVES
ncbi:MULTISPECIES: OmpH family outer membrane protein [unclassified Halanaerobium]|uniref:OmpH family outer membrane protein n=1 Tax=unclassified Halanaerobium TaxID=2641197 RepID=UPI000DF4A5F5|nr:MULTISPECIES: hypothetical protein [unclassified Halanaerobium]RCW48244.1 hypothetical protein DFR78_10917 [Halanaerobium sp. MA284_MarDTE_T2]RCW85671.1 hypothetical protein DER71_11017 [Halanaerobium sp. DL-01]